MPTGSAVALMNPKNRGCELPIGKGKDVLAHEREDLVEREPGLGQRLLVE